MAEEFTFSLHLSRLQCFSFNFWQIKCSSKTNSRDFYLNPASNNKFYHGIIFVLIRYYRLKKASVTIEKVIRQLLPHAVKPNSCQNPSCLCLCVQERESVMGLLLLCGIRCALFVCFVSVGEAGPSQNVGSVSGSVRTPSSYDTHSMWVSDMANIPLNYFSVQLCVLMFALVDT